jgi:hypothetical protein
MTRPLNMGEAVRLRMDTRRLPAFRALIPSARDLHATLWDLSWTGAAVTATIGVLSEASGLPVRTVQRAITALEAGGFLRRDLTKVGRTENAPSTFQLLVHPALTQAVTPPLVTAPAPPLVSRTAPMKELTRSYQEQEAADSEVRPPVDDHSRQPTPVVDHQEAKVPYKDKSRNAVAAKARWEREKKNTPKATAEERLADPEHWDARARKTLALDTPKQVAGSLASSLLAYWIDKRTVANPDIAPPRPNEQITGHALTVVKRFLDVPGADPVAVFAKCRRIVDCAFRRECWPFNGEPGPVQLQSLANRFVFDKLIGHLGARIDGEPRKRTVDEQMAALYAEAEAFNRGYPGWKQDMEVAS